MQKTFFFAIGILFVIGFIAIPAYAEPIAIEYGRNYDKELIQILPGGKEIYQWKSTPEKIVNFTISGTPYYSNYKIFEDANIVRLETANSGSLVFNKNTCTYDMYGNGFVGPENLSSVKGIGWTVKGKANASSSWSNVNSINNAACSVGVQRDLQNVKITGSKINTVGVFQIVLDYKPGQGIKETMRAYNNNPAWTNHNIGFVERFEVPQFVTLGDTTYNMANQNNTILNRTWITNHKAQLVNLGNVFYDFGIGFANLNDITIQWINSKAYLNLNYLYPNGIVPYQSWFEVDPTFGPAAGTFSMPQKTAGTTACATAYSFRGAGTNFLTQRIDTGDAANGCIASVTQWDTTAIPDTAIITNSSFIYQIATSLNTGAMTCIINQVTHNVNAADAETLWNDAMNTANGSSYVTGDTRCRTSSSTVDYDLGATADTDIQNSLTLNRFAAGARFTDMVPTASNIYVSLTTTPQLQVVYVVPTPPNAITTLAGSSPTTTTVDLTWTAPNLNGGTLQNYILNYTTPCGIPTTPLPNGTAATSYTIGSLTPDTCYSFRASAATQFGFNITGANIVNVTTLAFNEANYTIGSFNFNAQNPNLFPIRYERINLNSTHLLVNVTFTNTINLACDLRYTYAGSNHTYHPISSIPVSTSEDEASFRFINYTNEITTFHCWDYSGNASANYVLTQTDFLLKQQVRDFRNGTFGTMGMMGAFDFITLIVIVIAMIGFNQKSETVGGIFCIIAVSVLAYFEIVAWWTPIISALAVVIMLMMSSARKE